MSGSPHGSGLLPEGLLQQLLCLRRRHVVAVRLAEEGARQVVPEPGRHVVVRVPRAVHRDAPEEGLPVLRA